MNHVTLVGDMVNTAYHRLDGDLNFAGYPSVFFDGGDTVMVGGTSVQSYYTNRMIAAGQRSVPDLDYRIKMDDLGGADYRLTVKIGNGVPANYDPATPAAPTGPATAAIDEMIFFDATATDPDADDLYYQFDWGDGDVSNWSGPYASGGILTLSHSYQSDGDYEVSVRVKDAWDATTEWSATASIHVGCCNDIRGNINNDPLDNIDVSDLVYYVAYSFGTPAGPAPACFEEADVDGSGGHDVGDIVYLVAYSFTGGAPPLDCP